jgi:TonB family protein
MRGRVPSFARDRFGRAVRARRQRAEEARSGAPGARGQKAREPARSPYMTPARRQRERAYRSRITLGLVLAVAIHLAVVLAFAPMRQRIPLVRHIGYEGALHILPEISVRRPAGGKESQLEEAYGSGSESFFEVVDIRSVEAPLQAEEPPPAEKGDYEEEYGEEIRRQLEQSLPQPTSRDVVIVRFVKPAYPPASVAAGVEGVVVLRLHVTKYGRVARAWLLGSEVDVDCEEAARRAVLQWRFRPHLVDGVAVDFLVDQRIRFRLHDVLDAGAPGPEAGSR